MSLLSQPGGGLSRALWRMLPGTGGALLVGLLLAGTDSAAAAPEGRFRLRPSTALDTVTGLEWQRTVDPVERPQSEAVEACASLSLEGGGWRLPSIHELSTLVDVGRFGPAIDAAAFPDNPGIFYWSSTRAMGDEASAWGVFYYGDVGANPMAGLSRSRCVRDAPR